MLLLSPYSERLLPALHLDNVVVRDGDPAYPLAPDMACPPTVFDWVVSYGWRHIVPKETVEALKGRIINIHISLLPWNRGADPNFWSWYDDTQKGVTIHQMDAGIDTGPILCQRGVAFNGGGTLKATYEQLHRAAVQLFEDKWPAIRMDKLQSKQQPTTEGSYHTKADLLKVWASPDWDTPVKMIEAMGAADRAREQEAESCLHRAKEWFA